MQRPRVSALVPARNEEQNIRACVESLLAQGDEVEVLVADDGSTDATAAIVRELARTHGTDSDHARLRLLAVPPLPPGWVGKNHALDAAARQAHGEWLLFTDADTVHAPGGLRASLERAGRERLDLLSLSPAQEMRTGWEKAVIPRVYRELEKLYRFEEVNDPARPAAAANGQYILIRREAYEALGGHAAFRAEILEDVALARAAKRAGFKLRFLPGGGIVRTRMYRSLAALWEGWTKNLYPLYDRRGYRLLGAAARIWLWDVLPLALVHRAPAAIAAWLLLRHAWYALRLLRAGENPWLAAYYWPGSVLFSLLLVHSLAKYRLGRPVAWKGRHYGIDSLTIGSLTIEKT